MISDICITIRVKHIHVRVTVCVYLPFKERIVDVYPSGVAVHVFVEVTVFKVSVAVTQYLYMPSGAVHVVYFRKLFMV
jgi:hypothetical protein